VSASPAGIASKLPHSHAHKATGVNEIYNMIRAASVKISKLYLHAVDERKVDPKFIPFNNEVFCGKSRVLHEHYVKKIGFCVLSFQLGL
jgi:hypothetical protein